jgi:hypothetical protein
MKSKCPDEDDDGRDRVGLQALQGAGPRGLAPGFIACRAPVPVARLHPLIRDTSSPATGPDHLVFLELAAQLRVLGPDHSSTRETVSWIAYLARQRTPE